MPKLKITLKFLFVKLGKSWEILDVINGNTEIDSSIITWQPRAGICLPIVPTVDRVYIFSFPYSFYFFQPGWIFSPHPVECFNAIMVIRLTLTLYFMIILSASFVVQGSALLTLEW